MVLQPSQSNCLSFFFFLKLSLSWHLVKNLLLLLQRNPLQWFQLCCKISYEVWKSGTFTLTIISFETQIPSPIHHKGHRVCRTALFTAQTFSPWSHCQETALNIITNSQVSISTQPLQYMPPRFSVCQTISQSTHHKHATRAQQTDRQKMHNRGGSTGQTHF